MPKAGTDLIAAVATPAGAGGIGIIRISGGDVLPVARGVLASGKPPPPRHASYEKFTAADGSILDAGVCLYFRAPHSFTGQDILELHGHGGDAVLAGVLARCLELGARPAEAGEFTLRAYLNGKMDLAQAEAVADLINANNAAAARAAANSMSGAFSARAKKLSAAIAALRADMETALDFADEETGAARDFAARTIALAQDAAQFLAQCEQGARLASGITAAIVGAPNVGKSSLFNRLCGEDAAITSAAAGTTRDLIARDIAVCGVSARLADTAGLRGNAGDIEKEGIARARRAAENAGIVLWVRAGENAPLGIPIKGAVLEVQNKTDARNIPSGRRNGAIYVSTKTGEGVEELRAAIAEAAGMGDSAPPWTARARHVAALKESARYIAAAAECGAHAEIAAAWLSSAQDAAASLTGAFDDEKLLGEIFSRFCIGK